MGRAIVTGLDVGTSSVRLVVAEPSGAQAAPRILALTRTESRGLRRGYVINSDEVAECIRAAKAEAERATHLKIKSVYLGLGGMTLESKVNESGIAVASADAEITESDVSRAIELAEASLPDNLNSRVIHTIPIGYKLDGKKILDGRPEGMRGGKLEVKTLFVTYQIQHLNQLIRAVEKAGLQVDDIVASPIAASFISLSPQQKALGAALANIGSQTTSIAVFEEGIPISIKILPIGSLDITNDIALGLRVPIEEAERIKLGDESVISQKKKLDEIIEARLSDMFELIENHLKKIGRSGLLPGGIVLTGGGSGLANIDKLAKDSLRLPTRVLSTQNEGAARHHLKDPGALVAYGLCLYGLGSYQEESPGRRAWRGTKKRFTRWLKELLP